MSQEQEVDNNTPTNTNTSMDETVSIHHDPPPVKSSGNKGIDIRDAFQILAERSSATSFAAKSHPTSSSSCDCCGSHHHPVNIPESAKTMGQTLDLFFQDATSTTSHDNDHNPTTMDPKNPKTQQQQQQEQKLQESLAQASVPELVQTFLTAQQDRVLTYRHYDQSLQQMLDTRNVSIYPAVCAQVTASFQVLSNTINAVKRILLQPHSDHCQEAKQVAQLIEQLQRHEKEKLQFTAALHLEKIRKSQEIMDDDNHASLLSTNNNNNIAILIHQSIDSLQIQLRDTMQQINEILEEIQCIFADLQ